MSAPGYDSYRESGIEWLGRVPAHWNIADGRRVFGQTRVPAKEDDEQLSSTQRYGVIPQQIFMAKEDQKVVLALGGIGNFKHVDKNDFVISLRSFQGGIERCHYSGCVSPAYTVLKPLKNLEPRFWEFLLKSSAYVSVLQSVTDGIRDGKTVRYEQFGSVPLPLPPSAEQAAIAAFLDRETGKIDALVEAQTRLIELLKEKRQAVISHAVNKGLAPAAPMKDPGVEWLGQVPAHWEVMSIKHAIELATSGPRGWSDLLGDEGAAFFQSQNIGRAMELLLQTAARINPPDDTETERARLRTDDVVVCITGARTGAVAHVRSLSVEAYINQHVCMLRPRRTRAEGRYLAYALFSSAGQEQLSLAMYGLKQGLGLDEVRSQRVTLPPIDEQRQIIERLDRSLDEFASLTANAEVAITLLQERRAALISAAVTGKIDVRGLAVVQSERDAA